MGQQEVMDCLKKEGKPLTGREIAELLDICDKKIYPKLNKLLHWGEIFAKEIPVEIAMERYGARRRMFIYSFKVEWFEKLDF